MALIDDLIQLKQAHPELLLRRDVDGVGIGPRTLNTGHTIALETTGEPSIVIVLSREQLQPFPDTLSATLSDGRTVTAPVSLVPGGIFEDLLPTVQPVPIQCNARNPPQILDKNKPPPSLSLDIVKELLGFDGDDESERDHLMGGIRVAVAYQSFRVGDEFPTDITVNGTLGFIGQTSTGKLVGVTCHHVIMDEQWQTVSSGSGAGYYNLRAQDGTIVLQHGPTKTGSFATVETFAAADEKQGARNDDFEAGHPTANDCICCRDVIGRFHRSVYTDQADAALILLRDETFNEFFIGNADVSDWRAEILGPSGSETGNDAIKIQGDRTVTLSDLEEAFDDNGVEKHRLKLRVRKYGIATRFTEGFVRCVEYTKNKSCEDETRARHGLNLQATGTDRYIYVIPYNPATSAAGKMFAASGDSGSAVVDAAGSIIGIIARGIQREQDGARIRPISGYGASLVPIDRIKAELDVVVVPFAAGTVVRPVPEGNYPDPDPLPALPASANAALSPDVLGDPETHQLVERTTRKILDLLRTDRRLRLEWLQHGGPKLSTALARALRRPGSTPPIVVGGKLMDDHVDALIERLRARGHQELVGDMLRLRALVRPARHAHSPTQHDQPGGE